MGIIFFGGGIVGMKISPYLSPMKNETPLTEQEFELIRLLWINYDLYMNKESSMYELTKEEQKQIKKILNKLKP